jgi:hypothetical protein
MSDTDPRQPGPGPLHATADGAEVAQAVPRPTGPSKYRLAANDPSAPLTHSLGRPLAGPGYTTHHCTQHLLCRPGGMRLLPTAESVADRSGMALSWIARDLLPNRDRSSICSGIHQIVSAGLGGVLPAVGYAATLLGSGCTQPVDQEPGTE